ncbi:transglycosylase domain-containing protein [Actinocorallia sp. A-T 12471]|uniref:transglycosylase domain-containing protein n=1 Tax=Actinocorallia sp. A-T 12471 TaxID=3089813 RepID=UPI0029CF11A5|nr:transglycosylase domain-containing protein [Actinocorallia sp. A-T 12471]MDX6742856.1 transglycosylase domain-containing protein [Actinocorallia sp. A-T 12471]
MSENGDGARDEARGDDEPREPAEAAEGAAGGPDGRAREDAAPGTSEEPGDGEVAGESASSSESGEEPPSASEPAEPDEPDEPDATQIDVAAVEDATEVDVATAEDAPEPDAVAEPETTSVDPPEGPPVAEGDEQSPATSLDEPTSAYTPFLDDEEAGEAAEEAPKDETEVSEVSDAEEPASGDPTRAYPIVSDEPGLDATPSDEALADATLAAESVPDATLAAEGVSDATLVSEGISDATLAAEAVSDKPDDLYAPFLEDSAGAAADAEPDDATRVDNAQVTRIDTPLPVIADDGDGPADPGPPSSSSASPQPGIPRKRGRWLRRLSWSVLVLLGLGVIAFAVAYKLTPVPETQQLSAREQLNVFYYSDGKTVIVEEGTNRRPVDLSEISQPVQQAVISAENRSFRTDPGVSFSGTFRAIWSTVTGKQVQGGSTITQQMVRNYYSGLSQERSIVRKLKEVMVSLKVSQSKDKDWIMQQYLNTIYFGRQSYGIQAAAQSYFKVDAKDLTVEQSAFLAAAIQQPTPFSKVTKDNRAAVEQRWRYVLNGMVEGGDVTQAEASAMEFPVPVKEQQKNIYKGQIGYMVNIAKKELAEQRGIDDEDLALGGLRIVTTFRKPLMDAAVKAVKDNVPADMPKEQRVGLTSVDPSNGEVVAMYGGRDYLKEAMSSSFGLKAQAGSGFKPFALAAALESGVRLSDTYSGAAPLISNGTPIKNSSGRSYGYLNLVQMTRDSTNTAYVRLAEEVGLDKVTKMAESLGIPESQLTANDANKYPSFVLGTSDVSPAQQAGAYAAFANDGIWYKPHVIKSITNRKGVERKVKVEGVRVMSKDTAADATYAMEQVVNSGTATAASLYDRDAAGKTGTTDGGAAVWFNGYIPQLSTSVGIFQSKNLSKPLDLSPYSAYGGVLPAMVWRQFMAEATSGMEVKSFPDPVTYDYTPQYQYNPDDDTPTGTGGPSTGTPTDDGGDGGEPTGETPQEPDPGGEPGQGEDPGDGGDGGDGGGGNGGEPEPEPGQQPEDFAGPP